MLLTNIIIIMLRSRLRNIPLFGHRGVSDAPGRELEIGVGLIPDYNEIKMKSKSAIPSSVN